MSAQGLDTATAPTAAKAKQMLDQIEGRWWNVYIGGPESGGHGWSPALVREYVKQGIDRFMLTYVGRQKAGPLTRPQGRADGLEAVRIAKSYGYSGHFPLCLDVENSTFESAPSKTVEYTRAWCAAVRNAGARPGVYANPGPLTAMAHEKVGADFVWVASWVNHGPTLHDTSEIPKLSRDLWARRGSRAWQYAGAYDNQSCRVLGVDVDINVADLGCLAKPPGERHDRPPRPTRLIRPGDRGARVERLTQRLARVRSRSTRAPYLDGPRRRFDRSAQAALKKFQREHGLDVDGVYGPATARALTAAVKRQRHGAGNDKPAGGKAPVAGATNGTATKGKDPARRPALRELIEEVRRLDGESERAWERLVAYGERRQAQFERTEEGRDDAALLRIAGMLERMDGRLATLVDVERRELALQEAEAAEEAAHAAAADPIPAAAAPAAAPTAMAAGEAGGPNGGAATAATALVAPARKPVVLDELSDEELQERVERLGRATGRSRLVLMRRYIEVEKQLRVMEPSRPEPREPKPPRDEPRKRPRRRREAGHGAPSGRPQQHIRDLQTALNQFTGKYLEGVGPLIVDGKKGPATTKRIRRVKFYLGYKRTEMTAVADPKFLRRLEHPRSPRPSTPAMIARGTSRRRKQHKAAKAAARPRAGVATFDGKPVVGWMMPHLEWARANGWTGSITSGYRTPEYSEHLCQNMCGAPSCQGKCAGRSSNHSGRLAPQGAIDVSDYARFGELMKRCPHKPRIFNDLPIDRVHFSSTGH